MEQRGVDTKRVVISEPDTIEKSVQLIIIVLICVFDPLAILLLVAANHTYKIHKSGVTTVEPIAMDEEKLRNVTKFGD